MVCINFFWKTIHVLIFMGICTNLSSSSKSSNKSMYQNVVDEIFKEYNPYLRPVKHKSTSVRVDIQFGVIQLLNVEEVSKTIECVSFMEMIWKDELLTWDAEEFDNITRFRYPHTKVWKPDIILTNTPDLNSGPVTEQASTNVILSNDGKVTNSFTAVYKATCRAMDMTNFPFDRHTCHLDFASWTYSGEELDVFESQHPHELPDSMKLVPSSEWDIVVIGTEKIVEIECCPNETYPTLRIKIALNRKPLYFLINIIIPTTITCYISFFGMFSPSTSTGDRMEKAFLGITTLLAVSLLMLTVSSQMPVTSTAVPLMGYFLGVYILTIAIAIIITSIIMHIDVNGLKGKPLPCWAKKWILEKFGRWLGIYEPSNDNEQNDEAEENLNKTNRKTKNLAVQEASDSKEELLNRMDQLLNNHLESVTEIVFKSKRRKDEYRRIRWEWSQLCTVLDRICLFAFLIWSTVFTICVLSIYAP